MRRFAIVLLFFSVAACAVAQTISQAQVAPASDPQAISLAQQSIAALTGGNPISDMTLNANVISNIGPDYNTGTGTFRAKGISESRVDLNLSDGTHTDARSVTSGIPSGAWTRNGGSATSYAAHNCWTDAAWFLPALTSLTQTANANFVFKYIGTESHNGISTQHIQLFQLGSTDGGVVQNLSTSDFYLDPNSSLPLAVVFNAHADDNMNVNLPTEVRFASYQPVNGVNVPFHFQKLINGGVVLDVTVTSVVFNSGVLDSVFSMQ